MSSSPAAPRTAVHELMEAAAVQRVKQDAASKAAAARVSAEVTKFQQSAVAKATPDASGKELVTSIRQMGSDVTKLHETLAIHDAHVRTLEGATLLQPDGFGAWLSTSEAILREVGSNLLYIEASLTKE